MEDPGIWRRCRPSHKQRRVRAVESPDGAYLYYMQTMESRAPYGAVPTSGGVPNKVLDGVILADFAVLEGGIYYIDRPSGEGGTYYVDRPFGETRLQYFDFATRRSITVAHNLGNVAWPSRPLLMAARFSIPHRLFCRRLDAGGKLPLGS